MTESHSSARRQQALDLLLTEKISSAQYTDLLKEIEVASDSGKVTSDSGKDEVTSFTGVPSGRREQRDSPESNSLDIFTGKTSFVRREQRVSQVGDVLAKRYRLESKLGRGTFGVVWRAVQLDSDGKERRIVAVKLLPPE